MKCDRKDGETERDAAKGPGQIQTQDAVVRPLPTAYVQFSSELPPLLKEVCVQGKTTGLRHLVHIKVGFTRWRMGG